MTRNELTKDKVQSLSTREIIMFVLFCCCFIVVVILQLNISLCYSTNSAIRRSLLEPSQTVLNYTSNFVNFEDINVESSYWDWLRQLTYQLYNDKYYDGFKIPENKRFAIPNLNKVLSPLRITQRRIKLTPNEDPYTSQFAPEGWASYGFNYLESFDNDYEDSSQFGEDPSNRGSSSTYFKFGNHSFAKLPYNYTIDQSFYRKGGFVTTLYLNELKLSEALNILDKLKESGFIDRQTRSIVVDAVLFNSNTDFFTLLTFVAVFEANGLLTTTVELYNLKRYYYKGLSGVFRLVCEILFCLLLIFYIMIEINEVRAKVEAQRREFEKDEKKA